MGSPPLTNIDPTTMADASPAAPATPAAPPPDVSASLVRFLDATTTLIEEVTRMAQAFNTQHAQDQTRRSRGAEVTKQYERGVPPASSPAKEQTT